MRQLEAAAVQHAEQMADAEERAAVQEELAQLAEQQYASKCVEVEALKKNATAPLGVVRSPGRQGLARLDGGDAQLQQSVDDATLELRQQLADRECEIMTLQETMADKETAHDNGCKALLQMTIHAKQLEKELKKQQSVSVEPPWKKSASGVANAIDHVSERQLGSDSSDIGINV